MHRRWAIGWRRVRLSAGVLALTLIASGCTLWGWGVGTTVGDGGTEKRLAPVQVGTSSDWSALSDGRDNACALQTGGTLWCWGANVHGEFGDGTQTERAAPVRAGTATWRSVSLGLAHTCGIKSDGTLWCWGLNSNGQLGDGTPYGCCTLSPVPVGTATWKWISAGELHTCGVQTDGSLWCWGDNTFGQVGDGAATSQLSPFRVGTASWTSVTAAVAHTCGIQSDRTLWCWGAGGRGQLGDGTRSGHANPLQVGAARWKAVSAGGTRTCGIHTNATLWCWGDNTGEELGTGTPFAVRLRPGKVGTATDWAAISVGGHQCGIRATDSDLSTLWCWGRSFAGQVGDGTLDTVTRPVQIGELDRWFAVSAGHQGTHALLRPQT